MIARVALVLARFFRGIARRLSRLAGEPPLDDPPAYRTLTDEDIDRIAERALNMELNTEMSAPEVRVWVERPVSGAPRIRCTNMRDFDTE
jgi:hypothetical protein